ncbi:dr1-associated corepressor homolog [Macrobrachium nipponense]|uniref:dr1-associated corepressor homolog n=1 Tax=Macrobrachium nipponense TaxID=159736 RepID=UPI0030C89390
MKACVLFLAVALATAQRFDQRRELTTAVRLAGPGFFQQGASFAGRSSFDDSNNVDQQTRSFSTFDNNNNFQNQNNNLQSTSFAGDRNFGSSQSFQNDNQFQSGTASFQGNQQNRFASLDSSNQNQFQNRQFQQNQQNTFSSNDFQQNRNSQFQSLSSINNFPPNRFQDTFNQQNSQNQFQNSFDRENSRNRITLLDNVQLTPSTRFQSASGQLQSSGISFQANRNQQNQFQQSNLNQRNFESNFRSNNNNRFFSGSQSQSGALFRSGSSSSEFNGEFDGVFEPLNLPSGASALLGSISTSFSCADRPYGYYADQQNSCRVFHVCNPYLFSDGQVQTYQYSFMCGEGTIFDQNEMTCKAEFEATHCQEAQNFYFRNEQFGRPEEKSF